MSIIRLMSVLGAFLLGNFASATAAEPLASAQESVDVYINHLFERVLEVQPYFDSDQEVFFNEIGQELAVFVDFREVARGVMGKYGGGRNGASPEQLSRFADIFKIDLVEFYGRALARYEGEPYMFLKSRKAPKDPKKATSVRMQIGSDDEAIEILYIMFLNAEGGWKLKNLYIEGINLRRQYYSQFDSLMSRNNNDIDKVIGLWASDG